MSGPPVAPSLVARIPREEDRHRDVCGACGFINYVNPKIVVG
jgi:hypothetical protein